MNGSTRTLVYAVRPGSGLLPVCVALEDDQPPPRVFSWGFTDVEAKMWLAPAPSVPQQLEENIVLRVQLESSYVSDMAELVISDGFQANHSKHIFAEPEMAEKIGEQLDLGEEPKVMHNGILAYEIVEAKPVEHEDWVEFLSLDGPTLDQMYYPRALRDEWEMDVEAMVRGESLMVMCHGPSGVGKTSGVIASARTAAQRAGKKLAFSHLEPSRITSEFYGTTERNLKRAIKLCKKLAKDGYLVVVLLDEMNALLGGTGVRYESNVDQRVRLTIQSLLSEPIEGVAIYGTMNTTRLDWLPPPVARRFTKRTFPRMARTQLSQAAALYATAEVLDKVGLQRDEFGQRVADFIFSSSFVVWTVHMQSGASISVRACDLHECSIGKIKSIIELWGRQVRYGRTDSLQALWTRIATEMLGVQLNENNVFDSTFLRRSPHDQIRLVERANNNGKIPMNATA